MGIKKCKRCKRVFSPVGREKICPRCKQDEERDFEKVKNYLWDHPGANVEEISEETEVAEDLITKFIKEGRFAQLDGVDLSVECERCGAPIKNGRFCEDCSQKLQQGFKGNQKPKKKKKENNKGKQDRMFTRD
ncbi:flagellar operon protein TIGR03826 [Halobacteroides halobius DSM 5150]|uniref:Flagellar operon protein TIGR03826 n=1 Tax=Halobacteroides halobius (strain ATCC 35273 / DSM 5150 / MD-1) TaxID=748449 RepID=L0KDI6_HALHC|nr:TIGR03826 family flagellar region protein [Halobacteroides halobius]AGB42153.1 flagellar operon protein TIGR03826 [Halobacteroides halobius DSM 5150]